MMQMKVQTKTKNVNAQGVVVFVYNEASVYCGMVVIGRTSALLLQQKQPGAFQSFISRYLRSVILF